MDRDGRTSQSLPGGLGASGVGRTSRYCSPDLRLGWHVFVRQKRHVCAHVTQSDSLSSGIGHGLDSYQPADMARRAGWHC